jgi:hypothetical protein
MSKADYVCKLCGADAKLVEDGYFRHVNDAFADQSTFCDKYGYTIPVTSKADVSMSFAEVARALDKFATKGWVLSQDKIDQMTLEMMEELGYKASVVKPVTTSFVAEIQDLCAGVEFDIMKPLDPKDE